MTKSSGKKFGSVKNIDDGKKKPFFERIWDYKPYMIIGIVIIFIIILYFFFIRNLDRGIKENVVTPSQSQASPIVAEQNTGKLVVVTDPPGAVIKFREKSELSPVTFNSVSEGEFIVVISHQKYKTEERTVKIEKDKTTELKIKLQK